MKRTEERHAILTRHVPKNQRSALRLAGWLTALFLLMVPTTVSAGIVYPHPRTHAEAGPVQIDLWIAHPENGWRTTEESSSLKGAFLTYYISWPRGPPRPGFEIRLMDASEDVLVVDDSWRVEPGRRRAASECPGDRLCETYAFRVAPGSGERSRIILTFELLAWADPATGRKDSWRASFEVVVNFKGEGVPRGSEWKLFSPAVELNSPPTMRAEPGAGIAGVVAAVLVGAARTAKSRLRRHRLQAASSQGQLATKRDDENAPRY